MPAASSELVAFAVAANVSRLLAVDYDLVSQSGGASARGGVPLTFFQGVNLGGLLVASS